MESAASGDDVPRISSVDPPPMSTTSIGAAGWMSRLRTAPSKDSAASSLPATTSGSTPSRPGPRPRRRRRWTRPGSPTWRRTAPAREVRRARISSGVLVDRRERPLQRRVGDPAGAVEVLPSRTIRSSAYVDVRQRADQQLDRVGAAVDRCYHARAALPPRAEQVEHLVAERVHPATHGERLAGQHVEALHAVGHATRGDPVDLGNAAELGPRREVALVGLSVRRRQLGVVPEPVLHLLHQAGALEGADPRGRARAGQVERRRERRAVRQPRLRRDDIGVAAGARCPTAWIARGARPSCAAIADSSAASITRRSPVGTLRPDRPVDLAGGRGLPPWRVAGELTDCQAVFHHAVGALGPPSSGRSTRSRRRAARRSRRARRTPSRPASRS